MGDQVVLLTGATSGLGAWLAPRLGDAGCTVLVHGRDPAKVERVVRAVGWRADGYVADLASLADCRRLAAEVAARGDLTVLVNNAGVGFGPPGAARELSRDGHELRWAVDYLAPVAIAEGLLGTLRANAPAQIVNVGSLGQVPIDFADLRFARDYDGTVAYRRAKLALAMWSFELADELADHGVRVNCIHPATFMDTAMVGEAGHAPMSTVDSGGAATLRLIIEERGTGGFFDGMRPARAHRDAYDKNLRTRLNAVTRQALEVG